MRKECVKRTIPSDVIRKIPIPKFTGNDIKQIKEIFQNIQYAYDNGDNQYIENAESELNNLIYRAYQLNDEEIKLLEEYYFIYYGEHNIDKEGEVFTNTYNNVSGQVEDIDVENMTCTIYLLENGEMKLPINEAMPGWFLRKGAEFSGKLNNCKLYDIKPLVYSYLDDDDVISFLVTNSIKR